MVPAGAQPLAPRPAGARGPVGNVRNPIVCLLVGMICAPYMLFVMYSALNELKAFRGKDDFNPLVTILLWIVFVWGMPARVFEAKQMAGVPNATEPNAIMYFLLAPYFLINDLNEIWQAAGGGQPMPGPAQLPR
jgi:hypothetical protein